MAEKKISKKNEIELFVKKTILNVFGFKKIKKNQKLPIDKKEKIKIFLKIISQKYKINLSLEPFLKKPNINNIFEQIVEVAKNKNKFKKKQATIPKALSKKYYLFSHAQRRMFVLYKLESDSSFYNINFVQNITGDFKIDVFQKAINKLIQRHEAFRTNFKEISGKPVQVIKKELELKINNYELRNNNKRIDFNDINKECIKIYDLSKAGNVKEKINQTKNKKTNQAEQEKQINKIIKKYTSSPFKLEFDPLIRVAVIKIKEGGDNNKKNNKQNKHILVISVHHIIFDGWSMNIFYRELTEIYNAILENKKANLPELSIQYKDYAEWEQSKENQKRLKKQEKYWLKELSGELPVLNLPTDKPRPAMQTYNGDTKYISIDKNTVKKLRQLAEKNNTTLFTLLFAVFNVFLHKISDQKDIIVGTPTTNRVYQEIEDNIGLFVNTLAVRTGLNNKELFEEFLEKIKNNILESIANKEYPFEQLVEKLNPKRDMSRNPLFSVLFQIFQNNNKNSSKAEKQFNNTKSILKFSNGQITKFDMSIKAIETIKDNLTFVCEYNTDLFKEETIERFLVILKTLTKNIINNPKQKINDLEIISKQEKQKLLYTFNNTNKEYPKNKTIQELFEEQARKTPKRIAVEFKDKTLTYEELNKKANQLANYLKKEEKVKRGDILALLINPSVEIMILILGILKAGCAYLPISSDYPVNRVKYVLENSNSNILITDKKIKGLNGKVKVVDFKNIILNNYDVDNLKNKKKKNRTSDLAVIIYTSGSTGNPKGVMLEHRGIINHSYNQIKSYGIKEKHKICQSLNYVYVASLWQFFAPLIIGARLIIYSKNIIKDPVSLLKVAEKDKARILSITPSMLDTITKSIDNKFIDNYFKRFKYVLVGGEKISTYLINNYYKKTKTQLVNVYGQAECSDDTLAYKIPKNINTKEVFEGTPIQNTQAYILNQDQKLQPIGIPGELYMSGVGLANGYINDKKRTPLRQGSEGQTKEVFLPHPFKKDTRIYKTGDLAKMHSDGNIEILGRVDHQIKIRGYRIEPGEIETNLKKHNKIKDVVVMAKEIKEKQNKQKENKNKQEQAINDKYLVAYYTSNNRKKISSSELKEKLKQNLPDYMIPNYFVHLAEMPLNANGKLDRLNLPEPKEKDLDKNKYIAPKTEIEKKVAKIWQEVLKVKKISRNDNFFNLGGHSLKAIQVVAKINEMFKIEVSLKSVFINPILSEFSQAVDDEIVKKHLLKK